MNRRQFLRVTGTLAASGLGLYVYGHDYELHDLEVVHRRIPIAGLLVRFDVRPEITVISLARG